MIDEVLAREAFRLRALTAVVATTGSTSLSATSQGFARAAGSFLSDGFAIGMEVAGAGFSAPNNLPSVISDVTTGFLTIVGGRTAQGSSAGRTLTVGLPQDRQWEGTMISGQPAPGTRPYIADQWVPGASQLISAPAQNGYLTETGFYYLTIYGQSDKGILAIRRYIKSLKTLFTPGTKLLAGPDTIHVWGNPAPTAGQLTPLENSFTYCQLSIPWWAMTLNLVAA